MKLAQAAALGAALLGGCEKAEPVKPAVQQTISTEEQRIKELLRTNPPIPDHGGLKDVFPGAVILPEGSREAAPGGITKGLEEDKDPTLPNVSPFID